MTNNVNLRFVRFLFQRPQTIHGLQIEVLLIYNEAEMRIFHLHKLASLFFIPSVQASGGMALRLLNF